MDSDYKNYIIFYEYHVYKEKIYTSRFLFS